MGDHCQQLNTVMNNISANYSDDQIKQAQKTFSQNQAAMAGMSQDEMQKTMVHLNDLLTCDPACQRRKKIDKLREKWKAAEYTEKNAPTNTAEAEKKYWIFDKGIMAYNNMLLDRYRKKGQVKLENSTEKHNKFVQEMKVLIDDYTAKTKALTRLKELLKIRLDENKALEKAIDDDIKQVDTNDRRVVYSNWSKDSLHDFGKALLYLYVVLVIAFLYMGPFYQEAFYSSLKGWLEPLGFILFPFSVYYIARFIVYIYNEIAWVYKNKVPKNVFINLDQ